MESSDDPRAPLLGNALSQLPPTYSSPPGVDPSPANQEEEEEEEEREMEFKDLSRKSQWIALAVMSGACAAFNGVFAKLYVTSVLS